MAEKLCDDTPRTIYKSMVCDRNGIGFTEFLKKFAILERAPWPSWAIELAIEQVCYDLAQEGIDYSEISLSIDKYLQYDSDPVSVINMIDQAFKHYATAYEVKIGLLLSLKYDSDRSRQNNTASLIDRPEMKKIFCGIDLVGDERSFDAEFYKSIFDKWRFNGKTLRAHVGEMPGSSDNVRKAIEVLGVNRIAHGIQASDDTLKLAVDRGVCFDLALHSNLVTGAWGDITTHPLKKMLGMKCVVTLNTDDPIQFNCSLDDEFSLAITHSLISPDQAGDLMKNAWDASRHQRHANYPRHV